MSVINKSITTLKSIAANAAAGVIQDRCGAELPDGPGQPVGDVVEGFRPGQRDPFAAGSLEWRGQSLRVVEPFEKFQALDTADPAG
ncbi:MAG: hypothetical protein PVG62_18235 [Desulfobacterales bacterium]